MRPGSAGPTARRWWTHDMGRGLGEEGTGEGARGQAWEIASVGRSVEMTSEATD
jgi:hypothetical protein